MKIPRLRFASLAVALVLITSGASASAQPASFDARWAAYKGRFLTDDGRVLDTGNHAVSHTEGQGYAMLFAAAADDRPSFTKIWDWTRTNLQHKENALFSWRWNPDDHKAPVADHNDAADGDMLIAWALIRASRRWQEPGYEHQAHRILADVSRRLLVTEGGRLVLLPGVTGFKGKDGDTTVNLSYYLFPALKDFARVLPSAEWRRLTRDGLELLADARFGRWGLTPDWLNLDHHGDISLAEQFPARFGFEAIRVPLFLIWGGEATGPRLASYLDFWNEYGNKPIPTWTDVTNNSVSPLAGLTGYEAIAGLARGFGEPNPPGLPMFGDNDYYYSASLTLLATIAQSETAR